MCNVSFNVSFDVSFIVSFIVSVFVFYNVSFDVSFIVSVIVSFNVSCNVSCHVTVRMIWIVHCHGMPFVDSSRFDLCTSFYVVINVSISIRQVQKSCWWFSINWNINSLTTLNNFSGSTLFKFCHLMCNLMYHLRKCTLICGPSQCSRKQLSVCQTHIFPSFAREDTKTQLC